MEEKNKAWKTVSSKYLFRRPWLTVRCEDMLLPNGNHIPEYYILEYPDWVNTIAITKEGKFVFVRQYRPGIGRTCYELCAGVCEKEDASPLVSAQRELWEETGYGNGNWQEYMVISANEAPQLAMTKRLLTMGIADPESADKDLIRENMLYFMEMRDNYGVQMTGSEDTVQQFDTSLADLDATIMTQYQLVASASNVPATKLLGTTPKGFNSTGEYEEANYREELESIQSNDLEELLQRHYDMLMRSDGLPVTEISITWAPLDSPTAVESADIELKEAQTDVALASTGAIDGLDIRKKLASNKESSYYGIEVNEADYVEANTSTNEASAMGNFASSGHEGETSAVFSRPS